MELESLLKKPTKIVNKYRNLAIVTAAAGLMSLNAFGQTANGTIKFNTQSNSSITETLMNAQATKISGVNSYDINGNTNQLINFGPWDVGTLSVEEFELGLKNFYVGKNPAGELNAFFRTTNSENVIMEAYNVLGQKVVIPKIINESNGVAQMYANFSDLKSGMYFINVRDENKAFSFKFLNNNKPLRSSPAITNTIEEKLLGKSAIKSNSQIFNRTMAFNYNITWDEIDMPGNTKIEAGNQDVEVIAGNDNALSIDMVLYENPTGDKAFSPLHDGSPINNTQATLVNVNDPSLFYVSNDTGYQHIFFDVHVPNNEVSENYNLIIEDQRADGTFITTTIPVVIEQDENGELNGNENVNVDPIPNSQDISFYVFKSQTRTVDAGVTLELINNTTNAVVDSQVSDGTGVVFFDDVPGQTTYRTRSLKTGEFTKTTGTFTTPLVDLESERTDFYNTTTVDKDNYTTGEPVTAAHLNAYKPLAYQTEWILGHRGVYFPTAPGRQDVIDEVNSIDAALGFPNSTVAYSTPFSELTPAQQAAYDAYLDANTFPGITGSNLEYSGSDTNIFTWDLSNGMTITPYSTIFKTGGNTSDWSILHHEDLIQKGHTPLTSGVDVPATALDQTNPVTITPYDIYNVNAHTTLGQNHFKFFNNGKPFEYNLKTLNFEE